MFVACKLPNGIVLGGVTLAGTSRLTPEDRARQWGFAITEIPDDVWNTWKDDHEDSDLIANNLVVGHNDRATLVAMLAQKKFRGAKSGLEQAGPGGKT